MSGFLDLTVAAIQPPDEAIRDAAQAAIDAKTKPRGSLGRIEALAVQLATVRHDLAPGVLKATVVLAAADHGYAEEGVSAYPAEVTGQMVANFTSGGAAVCVLARQAGADLVVVDAGLLEPFDDRLVRSVRIGPGTENATTGPAMNRDQAIDAIEAGIGIASELSQAGTGLIALGEMGIANSTAASALTVALTGADAAAVCGRGTGIDDETLARKIDAVRRATRTNAALLGDPIGALAAVGGFEIGVLTGVILGATACGVPVILDGFITGVAALVAARVAPQSPHAMIAAHRSVEPGHSVVLDALGLMPLLDLDLRLGEGSGATLALPLCHAAVALLTEMATFAGAGVTDTGR